MISDEIKITYIGGPTALLEIGGVRFLTDPTFDPAGTDYRTPVYILHKYAAPAVLPKDLGKVDYVLLSHDHHFDNLDHAGRNFLSKVKTVFTTTEAAKRLGGNAVGLKHWETLDITANDNRILKITGTPCRHGPINGDRGPVTGFVLQYQDENDDGIYISGDTVWYEGVEEVAKRFKIKIALLFMGAAIVREVGKAHLTMTAEEGVEAAKHFDQATIIPLHFEGWAHFSESRKEIENAFQKAGLLHRLCWPDTVKR